jgi:hypothetical protein
MMANVRRYEGVWVRVSFGGRLVGTPSWYVQYTLEAEDEEYPRAMTAQVDKNGEIAAHRCHNVAYMGRVRWPPNQPGD